ncbi:MAG: T9SS type A sorting domain-containing protein [Agriterribacter sp.]
MKYFVPFVISLFFSFTGYGQQYPIYTGNVTWDGSNPAYSVLDDLGTVTGTTLVNGIRYRINGVTYNHTTPNFQVASSDIGWLTQFNDFLSYGQTGTNADYFLYQGNTSISGNGNIAFDNVYFNNGAGNTMAISNYLGVYNFIDDNYSMPPCGILVSKTLYFNNGITSTNRNYPVQGAIAFVNSATYQNSGAGLSDAQHVDGFVSEFTHVNSSTGASGHGGNFTFPVGNATEVYQLQRSGTIAEPDFILTVGWVDGDPNTTVDLTGILGDNPSANPTDESHREAAIASIAPVGFWDWHYQYIYDETYTASAINYSQTITVSIPDLQGMSVTNNDLRLVGWDANNSRWINLSGSNGASGLIKGSTLTGTIPAGITITALAIGSVNTILPVTFGDFTAKPVKCTALLQWETYTEQNNSHFNVERSQDGIYFSTIAQVSGAGNSTTTKSYEYTDGSPLGGKSYYRITQVDFDGKYSSTPIRSIEMNCESASLSVYPNPASNQVTVKAGKAIMQVNVLSAGGQTVMQYRPSLSQNGGSFNMNVQSLQSGIYLLQIVNKDGTTDIIKLMKK